MDTNFCDNCHTDIPQISWMLHTVNCQRHRWYCEKCEKVFPISERKQHEEETHSLITCDCGKDIEAQYLDIHKRELCEQRLIPCEYCKFPVQMIRLSEHESVCGSRTEPCEFCNQRIQLRHLYSHTCESVQDSDYESDEESEHEQIVEPPAVIDELVICPFCLDPAKDYMLLQEHIFQTHPEVVT